MRKTPVPFAVLACASLLAAPAAVAADYFLKIEGIKGESSARAADGQIELQSFSWGASQQGRSSSSGSGGGAGKASMQDLSVTRAAPTRDAGSGLASGKRQHAPAVAPAPSPAVSGDLSFEVNAHDNPNARALMAACASGAPIPRAVLTAEGQRYELHDVVVTSCDAVGGEQRKIVTRTGHVTLMK